MASNPAVSPVTSSGEHPYPWRASLIRYYYNVGWGFNITVEDSDGSYF